jgi:hypothetical protein
MPTTKRATAAFTIPTVAKVEGLGVRWWVVAVEALGPRWWVSAVEGGRGGGWPRLWVAAVEGLGCDGERK